MNWEKTTDMECLRDFCGEEGAVLKYNDYVLATALNEDTLCFEAVIYEFAEDENEEDISYVECQLDLIKTAPKSFDDNGDAIKWCFDNLDE